ncbi:tetratricopeptide repeat protein [Pedobacter sp.]|uniref:tetratricopeptide repeat protein n=1 Tax=Pedobacter sp. TaxID=1411316 RepID=UPI003BA8E83D
MGLFDFLKKAVQQTNNDVIPTPQKFKKEEVNDLVLTALNILCDDVSTIETVMTMLKSKGYDDRQASIIAERAESLYQKHFASKVVKTTGVKGKSLNEIYADKRAKNDGVLPLSGVAENLFNSKQFQLEILSFAQAEYLNNDHNVEIVKSLLLKKGLSISQSDQVISKFNQIKKNVVDDFSNKLASGEITVAEITPNPEHQPYNVDPGQIDKHIAYGIFQFQNKNYKNADELFNKAIELGDKTGLAYANLGTLKTELGQYEEAIKNFDQAINLNHNNVSLYVNRALALEDLNELKRAKLDYEKALEIDDSHIDALNNLGVLSIRLGEYSKAVEYFNQIIKIIPEDYDALYNKATALIQFDINEALKFYVSINKKVDLPEIETILINALLAKDTENVVINLLQGLYQTTRKPKYLRLKSLVLYRNDKLVAFESLKSYLLINPTDKQAVDFTVNLAFELIEKIGEAKFIETVDECLILDVQNPTVIGYKIQILIKQRNIQEAIDRVEQLFISYYHQQYVLNLFTGVFNLLEKNEALARFESFAEKLDNDGKYQLTYLKGIYLKGLNDYDDAINLFNDLNAERKFSWNYYQIAIMENLKGNMEKCLLNLKKTFELEPELKEDARSYHELKNLHDNLHFLSLLK